jgi:hypothetical protein
MPINRCVETQDRHQQTLRSLHVDDPLIQGTVEQHMTCCSMDRRLAPVTFPSLRGLEMQEMRDVQTPMTSITKRYNVRRILWQLEIPSRALDSSLHEWDRWCIEYYKACIAREA